MQAPARPLVHEWKKKAAAFLCYCTVGPMLDGWALGWHQAIDGHLHTNLYVTQKACGRRPQDHIAEHQ